MSLIRWPQSGVTGEASPSVHIEGHDDWKVTGDEGNGFMKVRCECGWICYATMADAAEEVLHHLKDQMKE